MARIRIGFDVDSVALNYTDRFREVFKLFRGASDLSEIKEFNYLNAVREDEHNALYMTFAYMMQEILPLEDGFISVMRYMIGETSNHMQFITARQEALSKDAAEESIERAFEHMNVPPSLVTKLFNIDCVGKDGIHGSKVPKIKEYGMEYFMEDRRKNVLEISQAGVKVFMPRRTWNVLPEDTPNVIQYNHPAEVVRYLRALSNK